MQSNWLNLMYLRVCMRYIYIYHMYHISYSEYMRIYENIWEYIYKYSYLISLYLHMSYVHIYICLYYIIRLQLIKVLLYRLNWWCGCVCCWIGVCNFIMIKGCILFIYSLHNGFWVPSHITLNYFHLSRNGV